MIMRLAGTSRTVVVASLICALLSHFANVMLLDVLQDYTQPGATVAYIGLFATHWVYFLLLQQLKRLKDRYFPKEVLDTEAQEQLKSE